MSYLRTIYPEWIFSELSAVGLELSGSVGVLNDAENVKIKDSRSGALVVINQDWADFMAEFGFGPVAVATAAQYAVIAKVSPVIWQ